MHFFKATVLAMLATAVSSVAAQESDFLSARDIELIEALVARDAELDDDLLYARDAEADYDFDFGDLYTRDAAKSKSMHTSFQSHIIWLDATADCSSADPFFERAGYLSRIPPKAALPMSRREAEAEAGLPPSVYRAKGVRARDAEAGLHPSVYRAKGVRARDAEAGLPHSVYRAKGVRR